MAQTIDPISLLRLKTLHPKLREEAITAFTQATQKLSGRAFPRVTEALRTFATSDAYYAQGRTSAGPIITNAPGGKSYHNYGLAFDFALVVDNKTTSWNVDADYDADCVADWLEVVAVMKKFGWTWGGDFRSIVDRPHFERNFGLSTSVLLVKHNKKLFIPGTEYVNI